jgi:hypothetical protein
MAIRVIEDDGGNEVTHRAYVRAVMDWAIAARIEAKQLQRMLRGHLDARPGPDGRLVFDAR